MKKSDYIKASNWLKKNYSKKELKDKSQMIEMIRPYSRYTGIYFSPDQLVTLFLYTRGELVN